MVKGMVEDFMVQTGKRLDDIITKLEELLAKLSFSIEALKEELKLTTSEVALMKEDIAKSSNKASSISKKRRKERGRGNHHKGRSRGEGDRSDKGKEKATTSLSKHSCFLCKGSHRVRACPQREKLNAMLKEKEAEEDTCQVNTLQLLSTIMFVPKPCPYNLMHVAIRLNDVEVFSMLDTGPTNNFITTRVKTRLGLTVIKIRRPA
ncbi:unnamed protein product [Citrullus colocynthis]|uniref:Gag-asp_proteas domain-containing protein n=1 Tax=Citrullus colocynthis TaxID=252529 RepID=A0ABP0XVJ2_9ROSI